MSLQTKLRFSSRKMRVLIDIVVVCTIISSVFSILLPYINGVTPLVVVLELNFQVFYVVIVFFLHVFQLVLSVVVNFLIRNGKRYLPQQIFCWFLYAVVLLFFFTNLTALNVGFCVLIFASSALLLANSTLTVLVQRELIESFNAKQIVRNYKDIIYDLYEEVVGARSFKLIGFYLVGLWLQVLFPDFGFFLEFKEAMLLLGLLLLTTPFKDIFFNKQITRKEWLRNMLGISHLLLVSILISAFLTGITGAPLSVPSTEVVFIFADYVLLVIIAYFLIAYPILRYKYQKTKFFFNVKRLNTVLTLLSLILIVTSLNTISATSIFSLFSVVSFSLLLIIIVGPIPFIFRFYHFSIFQRRHSDSRADTLLETISSSVNAKFGNKHLFQDMKGNEYKDKDICEYYTSSIIYDYYRQWTLGYILVATAFLILSAVSGALFEIQVQIVIQFFAQFIELEDPGFIKFFLNNAFTFLVLMAIFLGSSKGDRFKQKFPSTIDNGEPTELMELKLHQPQKRKQFLYTFLLFSIIFVVLPAYNALFVVQGLLIAILVRFIYIPIDLAPLIPNLVAAFSALLSLIFVLITFKISIGKIIRTHVARNDEVIYYNPFLIFLVPFSTLRLYIELLQELHFTLYLTLNAIYLGISSIFLFCYFVFDAKKELKVADKRVFLILNFVMLLSSIFFYMVYFHPFIPFFLIFGSFMASLFVVLYSQKKPRENLALISFTKLLELEETEFWEKMLLEIKNLSKVGILDRGIKFKLVESESTLIQEM